MKCEICHFNEACIEVKQIVDGSVREAHLCGECAAHKGFKSPEDLASLLMGDVGLAPLIGDGDDAGTGSEPGFGSCPGCHMRAADFRKSGRLGCGRCYETFSALLAPMLVSMQRATGHAGKRPARLDVQRELEGLRHRLDEAVRREGFEEAAGLRDRIRVLELAAFCLDPVPDARPVGR